MTKRRFRILGKARRAHWLAVVLLLVTILGGSVPTKSSVPASVGRTKTGSALFLVDFDRATGKVIDVRVLKSTGSAKLDAVSIQKFRQWRAKPGVTRVKIPMTYTIQNGDL